MYIRIIRVVRASTHVVLVCWLRWQDVSYTSRPRRITTYHTLHCDRCADEESINIVLGKSCILPPDSVGGYPSPEEPPTPETSEDILRREMLMLTTRLVVQSVCAGTETPAEVHERGKVGTSDPPGSEDGGRTQPGQGTSDWTRLRRNSRGGRVEQPPTSRAAEPPTPKHRRIRNWAEDPSLRPAEAPVKGWTKGLQCEITRVY